MMKIAEQKIIEREVEFLEQLSEYDCFPKLIEHEVREGIIIMTYCGKELSDENCPDNYGDQVNAILDTLSKHNIYHNDIRRNNVCVLNEKIYLIDFGYATIRGDLHRSKNGFPGKLCAETRKSLKSDEKDDIHFEDVRSFQYVFKKLNQKERTSKCRGLIDSRFPLCGRS